MTPPGRRLGSWAPAPWHWGDRRLRGRAPHRCRIDRLKMGGYPFHLRKRLLFFRRSRSRPLILVEREPPVSQARCDSTREMCLRVPESLHKEAVGSYCPGPAEITKSRRSPPTFGRSTVCPMKTWPSPRLLDAGGVPGVPRFFQPALLPAPGRRSAPMLLGDASGRFERPNPRAICKSILRKSSSEARKGVARMGAAIDTTTHRGNWCSGSLRPSPTSNGNSQPGTPLRGYPPLRRPRELSQRLPNSAVDNLN